MTIENKIFPFPVKTDFQKESTIIEFETALSLD